MNQHSLTAPRVHVINADAFRWLDTNTDQYDFIVADFPDPTSYALGKLFTTAFYRLAAKHLRERRIDRGAKHVAAVRAAILLVHRRIGEAGRAARLSVSRVCAVVRRMGLRDRQLRAV